VNGFNKIVIETLNNAGHEAYLVGGSVRDMIMSRVPKDWDITTSALPDDVIGIFRSRGYTVVPTGLKHGTVTVIVEGDPIEVTTFRTDGEYSDNRRPDKVTFTKRIEDDLVRRDFTMNAIAWHPDKGFIDPYGGKADIEQGIIRAVGNPEERIKEDALRILRALRFSAVLGFGIDESLVDTIRENKNLLKEISAERIGVELEKAITGEYVAGLFQYAEILGVVIPEITPMVGFDQKSSWHLFDLWEHTIESIKCAPVDKDIRLALLFHDTGKPETFSVGDNGEGHFYGHSKISESIARKRLRALKFDNETISTVCALVKYHDTVIEKRGLLRWLNRLGEVKLRKLIEVKIADSKAQNPAWARPRMIRLESFIPDVDQIIEEQKCFSLKDLAVDGRDIIALGVQEGPMIGEILKSLLDEVIEGNVENERQSLLVYVLNERRKSEWNEKKRPCC
jgi:tRNA nucleotidyltransferase (CCA-adding enzyme)